MPDLLEALKALLDDYQEHYAKRPGPLAFHHIPAVKQARAALAKARGEEVAENEARG